VSEEIYTVLFCNGIEEVVSFWKTNYKDLRGKSELFKNSFYNTTLPDEVIEAIAAILFKKDLTDHSNPQRPSYAVGNEGGFFFVPGPKGKCSPFHSFIAMKSGQGLNTRSLHI
jgi:hypothetical protein